ncbi:hypothetical protein CPB83DRAFT_905832 [Crepidotus variabilis]|uniref:Uncharacterized protein n=1 Tax=Crepidotus variabilis TaxID=179855 RepID=A0A9P6EII6_9AGAR|nr:hypothetical protein CPB83DRAFT_905832 [Crepidotus variabilis]
MLSRTARASQSLKSSSLSTPCQRQQLLLVRLNSTGTTLTNGAEVPALFEKDSGKVASSRPSKSDKTRRRPRDSDQHASHAETPTYSTPNSPPKGWIDYGKEYPSLRTAVLRFWEPLHNVADVWTVKRSLEKKYGRILETHFLKDYEMHDQYSLLAYVIFAETESLQRVPQLGEQFTVVAPRIPTKPVHEIGLEDLEGLSQNEDYQAGFTFDSAANTANERVIGGTIRVAATEYCANRLQRSLFQPTSRRTMAAFRDWGGFNPLPPQPGSSTSNKLKFTDQDLFQDPTLARKENTRMRAALQMCSDNLWEVSPTTASPNVDQSSVGVNPLAKLGKLGQTQSQSGRVFAGLYENVQPPTLGRLRNDKLQKNEDIIIAVDPPSETLKTTTQLDVQATSTPEQSKPIPQKAAPTPEERLQLQTAMNAARMLTKAVSPAKRRQPKPAIATIPTKKGQKSPSHERQEEPGSWLTDGPIEAEAKVVDENKGVLARIAGLFGR